MRVEETNFAYLDGPTKFNWKNGYLMGDIVVHMGDTSVWISFVLQDAQGKLRLVDPFIVNGALDLECPQCNRKNEPILFHYGEDDSGRVVTRRYFYCCPHCQIHYTSWGQHADCDSERTRIARNCTQNGDHQGERREFEETIVVK